MHWLCLDFMNYHLDSVLAWALRLSRQMQRANYAASCCLLKVRIVEKNLTWSNSFELLPEILLVALCLFCSVRQCIWWIILGQFVVFVPLTLNCRNNLLDFQDFSALINLVCALWLQFFLAHMVIACYGANESQN